jgi:lactate dehydrogenase-like 2-hydroxyacid dehydrogenase
MSQGLFAGRIGRRVGRMFLQDAAAVIAYHRRHNTAAKLVGYVLRTHHLRRGACRARTLLDGLESPSHNIQPANARAITNR